MNSLNQPKKRSDLKDQSEYMENLSHELLTPLTIIRTEAELLLQSEHIVQKDVQHIDKIIETVNRLAQINKGLILLSKIQNGIYIDREVVHVNNLVNKVLVNFENLIELKQLKVKIVSDEQVSIETNKTLLEILMTNALKNAITHNMKKGELNIIFSKSKLEVINSGKEGLKQPEELFNRFVSDSESSSSVGLGLSIMLRISELFNYNVEYSYKEGYHKLSMKF